jgi:hypothetical protein
MTLAYEAYKKALNARPRQNTMASRERAQVVEEGRAIMRGILQRGGMSTSDRQMRTMSLWCAGVNAFRPIAAHGTPQWTSDMQTLATLELASESVSTVLATCPANTNLSDAISAGLIARAVDNKTGNVLYVAPERTYRDCVTGDTHLRPTDASSLHECFYVDYSTDGAKASGVTTQLRDTQVCAITSERWSKIHMVKAVLQGGDVALPVLVSPFSGVTSDQYRTLNGVAYHVSVTLNRRLFVDRGSNTNDPDIPRYHHASRPWNDETRMHKVVHANAVHVGIELEVDFVTFLERRVFYRDFTRLAGANASAEHDGSLRAGTGLEIITRPLALSECREKDGFLYSMLDLLRKKEADAPDDKHGLHVTINAANRYSITDVHRARDFVRDIRKYLPALTGRVPNGYCDIHASSGHHSAISLRSSQAVEVRLARATVDFKTLNERIDFSVALLEYGRALGCDEFSYTFESFKNWLRDKKDSLPFLHNKLFKFAQEAACASQ